MKSLLVLLLLSLLLVTVTVGNYIYINDVSDRLLSKIQAIPAPNADDCSVRVAELIDFWEQTIDLVCLSVSYTVADRISEHAATLFACAECGDRYGFYSALALLRDAVGDLRRLESVSAGSLF